MDPEHLESVLWMYRDRIVDLKRDGQIRDILISRHHRKPGRRGPITRTRGCRPSPSCSTPRAGSCARPASTTSTSADVSTATCSARSWPRPSASCGSPRSSSALVPYAARTPLETWILPRRHGCSFEEALDPGPSWATWPACSRGCSAPSPSGLGDPSYELVLHNVPNLRSRVMKGDWATIQDDYHWHIEVRHAPGADQPRRRDLRQRAASRDGGGRSARGLGRREQPLRDRVRGP